ncbi:copper chaperone PCu(A)C [Methylocystis heyeri]|uniref:Copper chaperone PCu(A)C n=1 Tax=Methylocystis heyeri TaxID=391905 RepID=A0A6B8KFR5_9HYPH|nr:copper chaperone PCu(A)C [Methylocystis heyeri]QGM45333.1 copper chaperone PCu(A)C [Methylocystis heyeri]
MMIKRRDLLLSGCALLGGAAAASLVGPSPASAHEYEIGKLIVEHPWVRAPADGDNKAYFYAFIHNNGDAPDRLIGIKAEKFGKIEFQPDARQDGAATGVILPPKQSTTLAPGGAYVLLTDFKKHIEVGWGLEMTLVFEKAGEVVIDAAIEAPDALHAHDAEAQARWEKAHNKDTAGPAASGHDHDHHDHGDHDHHHDAAPAAKQ